MKLQKSAAVKASKNADMLINLDEEAGAYCVINEQIAKLGEEKTGMRGSVLQKVNVLGSRNSKGHLEVDTARFSVTAQNREKVTVNVARAKILLIKKGLLQQVEKQRVDSYLDQAELVRLNSEGKISNLEMESIVDIDKTQALIVKARKK